MVEVRSHFSTYDIFLGHEGGDDFVAVLPYNIAKDFCELLVRRFDAHAETFYDEDDRKRGYIEGVDRSGNVTEFGIVSITVAFVSNKFKSIKHTGDIVKVAAELKKIAKNDPNRSGSFYKEDRRK